MSAKRSITGRRTPAPEPSHVCYLGKSGKHLLVEFFRFWTHSVTSMDKFVAMHRETSGQHRGMVRSSA
jgi:hypothetical protein